MAENVSELDNAVSLPAVVDLLHASVLKTQLERGLASGQGLTIDGSAVKRIGSPALQVLLAGANAFAKAGGPGLQIENASAEFLETVSTLGLADALRLVGA